jgi:hypothetical protein
MAAPALDPHLAALLASTTGVGFLMVFSGVRKNALEWKHRRRRCPSCGRQIRNRTCGCTAA